MASIILCTHNPRPNYLQRVLGALEKMGSGEILLVDSASYQPIENRFSHFRSVKVIRNEEVGLTQARLTGIRATSGDPVIFVDDDTVLRSDYLEQAVRILKERPYLGAIGGQLVPEYEGALPLDASYYRHYLAIREFTKASWSNRWDDFESSPIGGGMVVRRDVSEAWAKRVESTPWRLGLGRNGARLSGGEDIDLVHASCEMDYGKGVFPELILTHLIPAERLKSEFLVKIYEGNCQSTAYLSAMLAHNFRLPKRTIKYQMKCIIKALAKNTLDRRLFLAGERGRWAGLYKANDVINWSSNAEDLIGLASL